MQSRSSYENIADEYYQDRHITSRNFDFSTRSYIHKIELPTPVAGPVLELGAGRGRISEFCGISNRRVIHLDISSNMLQLEDREQSFAKVQADALELPIKSRSVAIAAAFLFDPYNCPQLYSEISRILMSGGLFIGTLPHRDWGHTLRKEIHIGPNETKFEMEDGSVEVIASRLMSEEDIDYNLTQAGLHVKSIDDTTLSPEVANISPHILMPAKRQGIEAKDLPIITFILAQQQD